MSSYPSSLSWLCESEAGWAGILVPFGLFVLSEAASWIPEDKLKANSITQVAYHLIVKYIQKRQEESQRAV